MISVAMAAYNGEKYIKEQLLSILKQTKPVDEVIISDDGSTDNTVKIVNNFINEHNLKSWKLYKTEHNLGFENNFYNAIKNTSGDVIFLSDQDDLWLPEKVEVMTNLLSENEDILALNSWYGVIDAKGNLKKDSIMIAPHAKYDGSIDIVTTDSLIGCPYLVGCAMCFKKTLIPYLKLDEFKGGCGHDWYINIVASVVSKSAILNKSLLLRRDHFDNCSLRSANRSTLLYDTKKRIDTINKSIYCHSYILKVIFDALNITLQNDNILVDAFNDYIKLQKERAEYLSNASMKLFIKLFLKIKIYRRFNKSYMRAFKTYIGDYCFANNINIRLFWRKNS